MGTVCLSVCLSFCERDYCKSSKPISLKLGVMIGPTSWKNWLTFRWRFALGYGLRHTFRLPSPLRRRSISFSHIQSQADFHDTPRNDWCRPNPQHFGSDPINNRIRIRINTEIRIRIPNHFRLRLDAC